MSKSDSERHAWRSLITLIGTGALIAVLAVPAIAANPKTKLVNGQQGRR